MELRVFLAVSLSVLYSLQLARGEGVELNDNPVPNFGILGHREISGDGDSNNRLICRTDNPSCCRGSDNPNGGGFGNWYYPNGSRVNFPFEGDLPTGQIYRMLRNNQAIWLRRDGSATASTANGIYRCEVVDQNGVNQMHYVGLYTDGAGQITLHQGIKLTVVSVNPLQLALTCITAGGPPTDVTWNDISSMNSLDDEQISKELLNGATSFVRLTARFPARFIPVGTYNLRAWNMRSRNTPVQAAITITNTTANVPSGLTVIQSGLTSVDTSWTTPASGGATRTGYRIFYETGGSEQVADAGAGATSHTLTGLQSRASYNISIVAFSNQLPSTVVGPVIITVETPPNPPTSLMVVQSGLTSVYLSWVAPAPGGAAVTGYRVFYQPMFGSEQSVDVEENDTSLTGLQPQTAYNISVMALSILFQSTTAGPVQVTLENLQPPTVVTQVLNSTSIRVSFRQSSGPLVERYDIQLSRVIGAGQELCPYRYDATEDFIVVTGATAPTDFSYLQEFSTYSIAVSATLSGVSERNIVMATTLSAAPESAPRDLLNSSFLSTSITVGWNPVECIERNGVIDNYIVRFGPEGGVQSESTIQSVGISVAGTYTASGLTPFTRYSFEVAAVNSAGRGPFTAPLIVETDEDVSGIVDSLMLFQNISVIIIAWDEPVVTNGIIQHYEIEYADEGSTSLVAVTPKMRDSVDNYTFFRHRQMSKLLVGLKPDTVYNINIRPYNKYPGNLTSVTAKTLPIPRISDVSVRVVNTTAVEVSWVALDIAHAPGRHYKLHYQTSSSRYTEDFTLDIDGAQTSAMIDIELLALAGLEHHFSVAAAYVVEGEVFQGGYSNIETLIYNEANFELLLTPVDICVNPYSGDADMIRHYLHTTMAKAISEKCGCNFPVEHIREGAFRCWGSANEVTYRGSLTGTWTHTAEQLVGHLSAWVDSDSAVVRVGDFEIQVMNVISDTDE